jgi:hypothetical protein
VGMGPVGANLGLCYCVSIIGPDLKGIFIQSDPALLTLGKSLGTPSAVTIFRFALHLRYIPSSAG